MYNRIQWKGAMFRANKYRSEGYPRTGYVTPGCVRGRHLAREPVVLSRRRRRHLAKSRRPSRMGSTRLARSPSDRGSTQNFAAVLTQATVSFFRETGPWKNPDVVFQNLFENCHHVSKGSLKPPRLTMSDVLRVEIVPYSHS